MRPQKVLDNDILIGLTKVFRSNGYEGTSLKELAEATGLKKASLYHRFPNGKQEMAEAVFTYINTWVQENIFQALQNEQHTPEVRLQNGLDGIRRLYDNGKEVCIFRALSMQTGLELFEQQINSGMTQWIAEFTEIGIVLDFTPTEAAQHALQTLIEVQGSLIVTKGMDNISVFENTLKNIENRYLNT
ncbi:TetR/AcrR family transcriptional regulator [uncultured Kordia sp.]|uniref:TetR/AcrR family transcriptional regulator n=1 Tax=uncultured Kordia sp. TaxID=507699 RepID=UPI00260996C8|nr:TetR/AcrR family transcriptional regulator [uncultured Kordia sp.]